MTLAAVKPRKWMAPGLRTKLRAVAATPIRVAAPGLRVHHTVRMRRDVPIMSQRMGRLVSSQKMGATVQLRIAQRAAQSEIAAMSRLLK